MINKFNNRNKWIYILLIIILINISIISAADWYRGELHVYTGFRGESGYDGKPTVPDNCGNGKAEGLNVEELKLRAEARSTKWQGYADESFCLDSSEFNTMKTDCANAEDSDFTCLHGETLVVKDDESGLGEDFCVRCGINKYLCDVVNGYFGEAPPYNAGRIGAYDISNFIPVSGTVEWCPNSLDPQEGIDSIDDEGHGTHVTGIIASRNPTDKGIAYDAGIYAVK